jgi:hypothetical protein
MQIEFGFTFQRNQRKLIPSISINPIKQLQEITKKLEKNILQNLKLIISFVQKMKL